MTAAASTLADPRLSALLDRLHRRAKGELFGAVGAVARTAVAQVAGRAEDVRAQAHRFRSLLIPLSPEAGRFAYALARTIGARRIVEFGTSFGVSTLYLAAAVRDNGGGTVIGSEIEPGKVAAARANFDAAGLADLIELREGDARATLADPGGEVDMVLLDGWKDLYLPVLRQLEPHLRGGAIVLADNINLFRRALRPYVDYVQTTPGYVSTTLPIGSGLEYSVRL